MTHVKLYLSRVFLPWRGDEFADVDDQVKRNFKRWRSLNNLLSVTVLPRRMTMKLFKYVRKPSLLGASLAFIFSSCVTSYDQAGRPIQSVDPGAALVGVAAAGLIGYAIGDNNDDKRRYSSNQRPRREARRGFRRVERF